MTKGTPGDEVGYIYVVAKFYCLFKFYFIFCFKLIRIHYHTPPKREKKIYMTEET